MDFLNLRHDGGTSLHFYSPLIFMEMGFAPCQHPGIIQARHAAVLGSSGPMAKKTEKK